MDASKSKKLTQLKQVARTTMTKVRHALYWSMQIGRSGVALLRDSLAVVGLSAIVLLVLAIHRHDISQNLSDSKNMVEWLRPTLDQEFFRLSGFTHETGSQMTTLMGLDEEGIAFSPQLGSDKTLQNQQQLLSNYLAKRYRISQNAASLVVAAAYETGKEIHLDPLLLLSVMAVESSLNPFAESTMGAQGLMQVLTKVHEDKLEAYGGKMAVLNPVVNIKVGAIVLRDCIRRGGSLEAGLKLYVGATTNSDGGYGIKVMATRAQLQAVLGVPLNTTAAAGQPKINLQKKQPPLVTNNTDFNANVGALL